MPLFRRICTSKLRTGKKIDINPFNVKIRTFNSTLRKKYSGNKREISIDFRLYYGKIKICITIHRHIL